MENHYIIQFWHGPDENLITDIEDHLTVTRRNMDNGHGSNATVIDFYGSIDEFHLLFPDTPIMVLPDCPNTIFVTQFKNFNQR